MLAPLLRQDVDVSILEFISSLKWPIVVPVIGFTAMSQLRGTPEARSSLAEWFRRQNFRFHVADQELEMTLADTVDNMTAAASGDGQLAACMQGPHESGLSNEVIQSQKIHLGN